MAVKRYIDPDLWKEDWFIRLPIQYKLFFIYFITKCDNGGILRPNIVEFELLNNVKIDLDEFLLCINADREKGNERIQVLHNKRWFLRGFFRFQYTEGEFSMKSGSHKGALRCWLANGIHPYEVLGKQAEKLRALSINELNTMTHRRLTNESRVTHRRDTLKRESIKGEEEDLEGSLEEPIGYAHEKNFVDTSPEKLSLSPPTNENFQNASLPTPTPAPEKKRKGSAKAKQPPKPPELLEGMGVETDEDGVPKRTHQWKLPEEAYPWPTPRFKEAIETWMDHVHRVAHSKGFEFPLRYPYQQKAMLNELKCEADGIEERAYRIIDATIQRGDLIGFIKIPKEKYTNHGTKPPTGAHYDGEHWTITEGNNGVRSGNGASKGATGPLRSKGGTFADLENAKFH